MEKEILCELEYAEANLQDDIQALGYLIDEYFVSNNASDTFEYQYSEIKSILNLLFKSMIYNHDEMKKTLNKNYIKKKNVN